MAKHSGIAYWGLFIPLMYLMAFKPLHWGFLGLWISITVAEVYMCLTFYLITENTDWEEQS